MAFGDVVVLLPGISGSALVKDGRAVWGTSTAAILRTLATGAGSIRSLTLAGEDDPTLDDLGDGVTATALVQDLHLIPGLWKIDGYSKTRADLVGRLGLTPGENYFELPYDWRRDNRVAARMLERRAMGWLRRWRERSGHADAKLALVVHSMGGLVARHFLEVLGGWRETRTLVSFGTPYAGSLRALGYLADGFGAHIGPVGVDFSDVLRSFTSVYQLLPTYRCVIHPDGSLGRVAETAGILNVSQGRAESAAAFHRGIAQAQAANATEGGYGYATYPVVGIAQPTMQSARFEAGRITLQPTHPEGDRGGDGTVPRVSATPDEIRKSGRDMYAADAHGSLQNAAAVLEHLYGVLTNVAIDFEAMRRGPGGIALGLDIEDAYAEGEIGSFSVVPARPVPPLRARIAGVGGSGAEEVLTLRPRADGSQVGAFRLPAGAFRIRVEGGEDVSPVTDTFVVVGARPSSPLVLASRRADPTATPEIDADHADPSETEALVSHDSDADGDAAWDFDMPMDEAEALDLDDETPDLDEEEGVAEPSVERSPPEPVRRGGIFARFPGSPQSYSLPDWPVSLDSFRVKRSTSPISGPAPAQSVSRPRPPPLRAPEEPSAAPGPAAPAGTADRTAGSQAIVRYPAIEPAGRIVAGRKIVVGVDLLSDPASPATQGGPVQLLAPTKDWTAIRVGVELFSTDIAFGPGAEEIEILRDAPSRQADFVGQVRDDLPAGASVEIVALFRHEGRYAGMARRSVVADDPVARSVKPPTPPPLVAPVTTQRGIAIDLRAPAPDLTVRIFRQENTPDGCYYWSLDVAEPFDALPERLSGGVNLGADAEAYAAGLMRDCPTLLPKQHIEMMNGIGEQLWNKAPECFRRTYWAMRGRRGEGFAIQFITDDPYLPWELMRPVDPSGSPGESILCVAHPVARWIAGHEGLLSNRLPVGETVTIAPRYADPNDFLAWAQSEAEALVADGAVRLDGTVRAVLDFLKAGLPGKSVGLVHFAGHGRFGAMNGSQIQLEDGVLRPVQVGTAEVRLGTSQHPFVMLNACEVGSLTTVLGSVGGWAEVFSQRRFSGVLAPLWAVYDQDASEIARELRTAVWEKGERIGEALRRIRAARKDSSATPFAYALYGDVMAGVEDRVNA